MRTACILAGKNVQVESENPRALPASIFLLTIQWIGFNALALDLPATRYENLRILPEKLEQNFINSLYYKNQNIKNTTIGKYFSFK